MGGAMRQAGIIAAPAIYALEHNIPRLQEDHDNCATCAAQLQNLKKVIVQKDVQTNILMLDVAQTGITPRNSVPAPKPKGCGSGPSSTLQSVLFSIKASPGRTLSTLQLSSGNWMPRCKNI